MRNIFVIAGVAILLSACSPLQGKCGHLWSTPAEVAKLPKACFTQAPVMKDGSDGIVAAIPLMW